MGAAFYTLLKTQPYLANRSFDPKYNAAYLNRFITGLIAGVILATALSSSIPKTKEGVVALSPGILAILGGFASEAVELILQRLVEVLLALFRGDGEAQIKAKATMQQATKNADVRGMLVELEQLKNDPVQYKKKLEEIHAALKNTDG